MSEAATTPEALEALLQLLRRNGVRSWSGKVDADPMAIEFFPSPSQLEADQSPSEALERLLEDAVAAGACACGHDMTSHNATGECLMGCLVRDCQKTPPKTDESGSAMTAG